MTFQLRVDFISMYQAQKDIQVATFGILITRDNPLYSIHSLYTISWFFSTLSRGILERDSCFGALYDINRMQNHAGNTMAVAAAS